MIALANLLDFILEVYLWMVLLVVILSWIPLSTQHPTVLAILRFLHSATEPVFTFFRRTCKLHRYTAPIDVTPLLVILAIYFLRIFVVQTLRDMAIITNFFQAIFYTVHFVVFIYFWIVAAAVFFLLMAHFFPQHQLASVNIPMLDRLTEPVFRWIRRMFKHRLTAHIGNARQPLDLAPILVLAMVYILDKLILGMAAGFF